MADAIVVEQLMQGITDPAKSALFFLVDHPNVALVAEGMTRSEAWALVGSIPFEVAVTIRPALVDPAQTMTFLLIAHLIIYWLSQDSNVTPPVCLAAFTAAGIAGSRPMATGFESWKIAKGLYIVPLLFAYTPLISGDFMEVMQIGFFSLFGIYAFNAIIQLYSEGPVGPLEIGVLAAGRGARVLATDAARQCGGSVALVLLVVFWTRIKLAKRTASAQSA